MSDRGRVDGLGLVQSRLMKKSQSLHSLRLLEISRSTGTAGCHLDDKFKRRGKRRGGDRRDRVRREEEEKVVKENNLLVGRMEDILLGKNVQEEGTGGIKVSSNQPGLRPSTAPPARKSRTSPSIFRKSHTSPSILPPPSSDRISRSIPSAGESSGEAFCASSGSGSSVSTTTEPSTPSLSRPPSSPSNVVDPDPAVEAPGVIIIGSPSHAPTISPGTASLELGSSPPLRLPLTAPTTPSEAPRRLPPTARPSTAGPTGRTSPSLLHLLRTESSPHRESSSTRRSSCPLPPPSTTASASRKPPPKQLPSNVRPSTAGPNGRISLSLLLSRARRNSAPAVAVSFASSQPPNLLPHNRPSPSLLLPPARQAARPKSASLTGTARLREMERIEKENGKIERNLKKAGPVGAVGGTAMRNEGMARKGGRRKLTQETMQQRVVGRVGDTETGSATNDNVTAAGLREMRMYETSNKSRIDEFERDIEEKMRRGKMVGEEAARKANVETEERGRERGKRREKKEKREGERLILVEREKERERLEKIESEKSGLDRLLEARRLYNLEEAVRAKAAAPGGLAKAASKFNNIVARGNAERISAANEHAAVTAAAHISVLKHMSSNRDLSDREADPEPAAETDPSCLKRNMTAPGRLQDAKVQSEQDEVLNMYLKRQRSVKTAGLKLRNETTKADFLPAALKLLSAASAEENIGHAIATHAIAQELFLIGSAGRSKKGRPKKIVTADEEAYPMLTDDVFEAANAPAFPIEGKEERGGNTTWTQEPLLVAEQVEIRLEREGDWRKGEVLKCAAWCDVESDEVVEIVIRKWREDGRNAKDGKFEKREERMERRMSSVVRRRTPRGTTHGFFWGTVRVEDVGEEDHVNNQEEERRKGGSSGGDGSGRNVGRHERHSSKERLREAAEAKRQEIFDEIVAENFAENSTENSTENSAAPELNFDVAQFVQRVPKLVIVNRDAAAAYSRQLLRKLVLKKKLLTFEQIMVGSLVCHDKRGEGTVVDIDRCTRARHVKFLNGELHKYLEASWHKMRLIRAEGIPHDGIWEKDWHLAVDLETDGIM